MKSDNFARIMIAGTGSGCGKTTITCGILKALVNRNIKTAAFKCGPDYIDTMFHTEIVGTNSRNLDSFLCGDNCVKYLFFKNGKKAEISVVEGVMGLYDGIGNDGSYSSNAMSLLTGTPVVLVVNGKGMSLSIAAMLKGYIHFMPNIIKGVIINDIAPGTYPMYRKMIGDYTKLKVLGFLPSLPEAILESRHLGLVTASEIENLQHKLSLLANSVEKYIDLDGLMELAQTALPLEYKPVDIIPINTKEKKDYDEQREQQRVGSPDIFEKSKTGSIVTRLACSNILYKSKLCSTTIGSSGFEYAVLSKKHCCNIAVAKDKAFCFYYRDSLELLEKLGAKLTFFSPLDDERLPKNIGGLILGGGYPELYAKELAKNKSMLLDIKMSVNNRIPTYAECGGFMYLQQAITGMDGNITPMVGAIKGRSSYQNKLIRFGYASLKAKKDNLFCSEGDSINMHEFHYYDSDNNGSDFEATKPNSSRKWDCIFATDTLFAGYPHIHLYGNINFARRFVQKCSEIQKRVID